jgi:phospholipase C
VALGGAARTARDLTVKRAKPLRLALDRVLDHPARESPIDTVVVVMLENRSFDHVLGWLATDETYLDEGRRRYGRDFRIKGSTDVQYRTPDGDDVTTGNALEVLGSRIDALRGCTYQDPGHSRDQGRAQRDLGFLGARTGNDKFAVSYFDGEALPHNRVIAEHFTVADRHYSSLLGPTFPNRMYMHAAQSEGRKRDPGPLTPGIFNSTTIWDLLGRDNVPATYYYTDIPLLLLWGERMSRYIAPVDQYFEQAAAGTLPNVVMVDPSFTGPLRADAHPKGDVAVAAAFVAVVLEALLRSPQWDRSIFVVTHDEWGGFFDTVPPITLPDNRASRIDRDNFGQAGFRVPAAHISPYIPGNAVDHTVYDHTSILRFIEWRFLGAPASGPGAGSSGRWWLTRRDRRAHPIGQLLSTTRINDDLPTPLIPADAISRYVPECAEEAAGEKDPEDPFVTAPEFRALLARAHPPAVVRPWELLGSPS